MFKQFNKHLFGASCNDEIFEQFVVKAEPIRQQLIKLAEDRAKSNTTLKKHIQTKIVKILKNNTLWRALLKEIIELQGEWLNKCMKDYKTPKLASLGIFQYNDRKHEWQLLNLGHQNRAWLNACWARYNKLRYIHQKEHKLPAIQKILSREEINAAEIILREKELKSYKINPSWRRVKFPLLDATPYNTEATLLDRNNE